MDARHCYFPNYGMGDYFQPSPSHWPLSHIRSSVRSQDDSSELDTFEMDWERDEHIPIPYQQRTIRNLTGRSLEESFARLKRKRSSHEPELEARKTPDPDCSRTSRLGDQDMGTDEIETKQTPTQFGLAHVCKQCDMTFARDSDLHRHNQNHKVEIQDNLPKSCTNVKAATIAMSVDDSPSSPRRLSILREKTPQPPRTSLPEPTIVSKPSSQAHINTQDSTVGQQASPSPSTVLLPREQSEDDHDAMKDGEPNHSNKVKKPKQKSNQQGSHICKLCDITFTRHFDLLRHNQKHQVEPEEDMARRTCTNCGRVLSRVDATKRHVDTLPESCNYLRRKQSLRPLPAMPPEHYDACREQYHKLAQERKKPKGRKKAHPA